MSMEKQKVIKDKTETYARYKMSGTVKDWGDYRMELKECKKKSKSKE